MKALLGKKLGMTQTFSEGDKLIPVTVIEAGPCIVTQVKIKKKEGYSAIQVGYGEVEEERLNKAQKGRFAKNKKKTKPRKYLTEFRIDDPSKYDIGQSLNCDLFSPGEKADVTALSKGKGFQGVVKRWGFRGGPGSHGAHFHRAPGAIGACATPSRVFKGKKLPGRLGGKKVTVKNLEVIKVDSEQNLLLVKGSIPGAKGSLVVIRSS